MFSRLTDREIKNRLGKKPLEVGADRIARTALAALNLLEDIREATGRAIPLAWTQEEIKETKPWQAIEVYPAATRLAHGTDGKGGSLEGLEDLIDCSAISEIEEQTPDAIDAIVCTLAAADFLLGRAVRPEDMQTAKIEGWIWAPGTIN
jgi:predicted nuclease with RNAse H fold